MAGDYKVMDIQQVRWGPDKGWTVAGGADPWGDADLVLVFGSGDAVSDGNAWKGLRALYPDAHIAGCSTAGEIQGTHVSDDGLVATALTFSSTTVQAATLDLREGADGEEVGRRLAGSLPPEGLRHVIVFSDGIHVNGSSLVEGMQAVLPEGVQVTGGLAGDGPRFEHTVVFGDDGPHERGVTAVGLYGDAIHIGYGSLGGWDPFGPVRRVTRSDGNLLYELDGQPALELYKKYLGEHADGLPATGLLFPLSVQYPGRDGEVVRTILGVDENAQSMTFAGDVPEGAMARLMKANFDRLVDGAHGAAQNSHEGIGEGRPDLALLISCVGRKLVLKQRTEEELEAVQEVLGDSVALTGFYSYGEICPAAPDADCELHNQTMTITTLREE